MWHFCHLGVRIYWLTFLFVEIVTLLVLRWWMIFDENLDILLLWDARSYLSLLFYLTSSDITGEGKGEEIYYCLITVGWGQESRLPTQPLLMSKGGAPCYCGEGKESWVSTQSHPYLPGWERWTSLLVPTHSPLASWFGCWVSTCHPGEEERGSSFLSVAMCSRLPVWLSLTPFWLRGLGCFISAWGWWKSRPTPLHLCWYGWGGSLLCGIWLG